MGAYIGPQMLTSRMTSTKVADLCTDNGVSLSVADTSILLNDIVNRAEGIINGYAGRVYATPLPASQVVVEWALRMAEYELYKRGPGDEVPGKYQKSYDEALKELLLFCEGKFVIDGAIKLREAVGLSFDFKSDRPVFSSKAFYVPRVPAMSGIDDDGINT